MPANASPAADDGDLILLEDDASDPFAPSGQELAPWHILIVDDDVDVHVVTKFALSNTNFHGRRLSFLHAYSAKEAMAILRDTPHIAMVLLDVIMETPDAGLRLARAIREELHNDLVRIVLRTGQPGQALEHSIIVDYDINDFWCKADLTTRKLFTTVISSLRAYATLAAAAAERDALAAELTRSQQLKSLVEQHALVLTADAQGRITDANDVLCSTIGVAREALLGNDLHALHSGAYPEPLATTLAAALRRDGSWAGDIHTVNTKGQPLLLRCAVMSLKNAEGAIYQYLAVANLQQPG